MNIFSERIDLIASELEQAGRPDMALALDRVSDKLESSGAIVDRFEKDAFNLKNPFNLKKPDDSDLIGQNMVKTFKTIPGVREVKQKTGLPGSGPKDGVDVFFRKNSFRASVIRVRDMDEYEIILYDSENKQVNLGLKAPYFRQEVRADSVKGLIPAIRWIAEETDEMIKAWKQYSLKHANFCYPD